MALSGFWDRRRGGLLFKRDGRRRRLFAGVDKILWWIPLAMIFVAGFLIASTQRQAGYADWYQHWVTAAVGLVIALLLAKVPVERITRWTWPIYGAMVASLIAVRLIGVSALGAQSWINIAGFNVQPSEFAKIAAILLLAQVLARHPVERPVDLVRPVATISIPWFLVLIQPDLGTSLVFGAVLLVMMFWSGMPGAWVVLLISPVVTSVLAGVFPWLLLLWIPAMAVIAARSLPWKRLAPLVVLAIQGLFAVGTPWLWNNFLQPHQRDRLTLFLDPNKDPLGGGYHLLQSTVGIGSGGWFGTGLLQGHLTLLRFIPEQHTDFIFSALGEETGFLGSALVVLGFVAWIWRLLKIAGQARTDVESLVVIGVGAMVMFQVVVNINMTIGLGPITGIPLPWLSYGRSAMLVNFIGLGLCASVARGIKQPAKPRRGWGPWAAVLKRCGASWPIRCQPVAAMKTACGGSGGRPWPPCRRTFCCPSGRSRVSGWPLPCRPFMNRRCCSSFKVGSGLPPNSRTCSRTAPPCCRPRRPRRPSAVAFSVWPSRTATAPIPCWC